MKLRKIICTFICAATVLSCLAAGVSAADSDFVIEDGVLTKYKGEGGDIVIPEGVTEIGREAFYHSETITSIVIPDGVTKIGYQAFSFSKNLKNVTIPDSVTDIGIAAFSYCTSLTEIRIPPKVTKIEDGTFHGDEALSKVIISEGVTTIGFEAFFACYGIESITLPESLIHIEDKAFLSCRGLKSITIPSNVKTIGDGALLGYNIVNVNVAEENESFKSIDGVLFTKNGKKLLQYPTGIKNDEYTIPNGTTHIGNSAFSGCENLIKVNIPEGVTHIGENTFSDTKFTIISLPATIHSIGSGAFDNCLELTEINVSRNSLEYYSIDGVLFKKSTNKLLKYPPKKIRKNILYSRWNYRNRKICFQSLRNT